MRVRAKLFATLARCRPSTPPGAVTEVDLPDGATIEALLVALHVPPAEARMIFVNGRARPVDWPLQPGDEVGVFPPIGGG